MHAIVVLRGRYVGPGQGLVVHDLHERVPRLDNEAGFA